MDNALIFTALLLLSALVGGLVGAACAKGRKTGDCEARLAEIEDRLDALATHSMDEGKRLKDRTGSLEDHLQGVFERLYEVEMLVGDTPTGGLLGRVGALEDAQKTHEQDAVIVNGWADEIKALKKEMDGIRMVNDAEHHALMENQKGIVKEMREAKGE